MTAVGERKLKAVENRNNQAKFGLANNAFGAAAGAAGTKLAWDVGREQVRTAQAKAKGVPYKPKARLTMTQRGLAKLKLSPTKAALAAGSVAVGSQLVNGAMDAQSASYFAREVKDLSQKEKRMETRLSKSYETPFIGASVPTSNGAGRDLDVVEKKDRRFDPEADRQRRLGAYTGAGLTGGLVATGVGASRGGAALKRGGKAAGITPKMLKDLRRSTKWKGPAGLVATGAGLTALGGAAATRAKSARNERWH